MNVLAIARDVLAQTWWLPVAALLLLGYRMAVRLNRRIPDLPVALFILYAMSQPVAMLLGYQSIFPGLARWAGVAATIILTWAVVRLVFFLVVEGPERLRKTQPMAHITRDFVLVGLFAASGIIVLRTHGNVNLTGILTTSAVLTAVIGLAMQTTLSSFFAGLALQIERPFAIGDWIQIGETVGEVTGITWRSTRLLTRRRQMVYVPNSEISASTFLVLTRPTPEYCVVFTLGVEYDAAPNMVRQVILDVLREHPKVLTEPAPEVRLLNFGDFAIIYEIRFFNREPAAENRIIAQLNNDLWYALRRHHIKIPFPIRDVQLAHVERRRAAELQREQIADVEAVLAHLPILAPLTADERARLAREATTRTFGAGEPIVHKGAPGASLYVVCSGCCAVFADPARDAVAVAEIGAGGCFGEMSLLTGEPRSATVRARGDATVLEIGKDLFATVLNAKPEIAVHLADLLAQRQQALQAAGAHHTASRGIMARIRVFFGLK